jgi:hypothetical protein
MNARGCVSNTTDSELRRSSGDGGCIEVIEVLEVIKVVEFFECVVSSEAGRREGHRRPGGETGGNRQIINESGEGVRSIKLRCRFGRGRSAVICHERGGGSGVVHSLDGLAKCR